MPLIPPHPPAKPLTAPAAQVHRAETAPPRPLTAVRAAHVGGQWVWLPVVDDDPVSGGVHSVRVPRSALHSDAQGRALPETDRVRVLESEYWVHQEDEQTDFIVSAPAPNPFRGQKAVLPGRVTLPPERLTAPHGTRPPRALPAQRALTPWMVVAELDGAVKQIEGLAGRDVRWGRDGQLWVYPHAYSNNEAVYSPENRAVMVGVEAAHDPVRHRDVLAEDASSRDVVAHEALGHALIQAWKPMLLIHAMPVLSRFPAVYSEAQGDLLTTWTSLLAPGRAEAVVSETHGQLHRSNAASRLAELMARLSPDADGPALRDAVNDSRLNVDPRVISFQDPHDTSEALTGALYDVFADDVEAHRHGGHTSAAQVRASARDAIRLLARALERVPENDFDATDLLRAALESDALLFQGAHADSLRAHFFERGLTSAAALADRQPFAVPPLAPPEETADARAWSGFLTDHAQALGCPEGFTLRLEREERTHDGRLLVRTQLMLGQGAQAIPLHNHGMLEIVAGKLVRVQPAFPEGVDAAKARAAVATAHVNAQDPHAVLALMATGEGGAQAVPLQFFPDRLLTPPGPRHPLQGVKAIGGTEVLDALPPLPSPRPAGR